MSKTPARIVSRPPLMGEHNEYVFRELLGMSEDKLAQLVEEKIVY
jgi:benzylsuccinate CoA-transferase BbsF subunit